MKCATCNIIHKGADPCACDPSWRLGAGDKRMIEMVMGKVHVSKSNMYVARMWFARKGIRLYNRRVRHAVVRHALKVHADHFRTYARVMAGTTTKGR